MEHGDHGESVLDIHQHLSATAERPVERGASRWIGEAEAVVEDLVGDDVDPSVLEERLGHVEALLANVEGTGDPAADEHVEAARGLVDAVLADLES